jgi:hypothetical protein
VKNNVQAVIGKCMYLSLLYYTVFVNEYSWEASTFLISSNSVRWFFYEEEKIVIKPRREM